VVGDAAAAAVARAACLQAADSESDFSSNAASLKFSDNWGADVVVQVGPARAVDWAEQATPRPSSTQLTVSCMHYICECGIGVASAAAVHVSSALMWQSSSCHGMPG
jgi:hypothetical protein